MGHETATEQSMQDISSRLEGSLSENGSDDLSGATELPNSIDDVALEDDESLPAGDDTDSDDDDGSEDLAAIAEEDDGDYTLAGYLGLDEDKLSVQEDGSVSFNAIINGETKSVPLKELAASYQLQGHVNNKSIALETERKEFETQRVDAATKITGQLEHANQLTKMVEEQLVGDFNKIDWNRLRTENPSEWSALRQEYAEKAQRVQGIQSQISTQQKQASDEQQFEMKKQEQEYLTDQMGKMVIANPTWSDKTVMKADTGALKSFLSDSYGFSDADFEMVTDHRLVHLIQDAKAYRSGKKTAQVKITKGVPKFQKPGAAKGNAASLEKARSSKRQKAAFKKTGNTQDTANILLNRM